MILKRTGTPICPPAAFWPWLAWAIFGNDDDGVYGDLNWNPQQVHSVWRRIGWWLRNPLHNFTFYVIGVAHLDSIRVGPFPGDVFRAGGGWNWAYTRCGRLVLPFISYNHPPTHTKAYIGWRNSGNFGIKLTGLPLAVLVSIIAWEVYRHVA